MIKYYKIPITDTSLIFNSKYEPSEIIRLNYKDIYEIEVKGIDLLISDKINMEAYNKINEETNKLYQEHNIPRYLIAYQDTTIYEPNAIYEPNKYYELATHRRLHFESVSIREESFEKVKEYYNSINYKSALCHLFGLYYEELDDQIKGFDEPKVKEEINIDYLTEKLLKLAQNNPEEFKQIMTKILENSQIINNNSENKNNNIKKLLMNISK